MVSQHTGLANWGFGPFIQAAQQEHLLYLNLSWRERESGTGTPGTAGTWLSSLHLSLSARQI